MTVLRGRRLAAVGTLESYTVTRPAPTEHTGLTTVLPTTEPGTSQISVTVAAGDKFLPAGLDGAYLGVLLAQILNNDAATRTLSYRMLRNGASVMTSTLSLTSTNTRGRVEAIFSNLPNGVAAGDTLELRLWCASSTNVQLIYWTYFLIDDRVRVPGSRMVRDCRITPASTAYPALASWPGTGTGQSTLLTLNVGDDLNLGIPYSTGVAVSPKGLYAETYGFGQFSTGDISGADSVSASAAANPTYIRWPPLSTLKFRRVPVP